jgi:hypothetical protein
MGDDAPEWESGTYRLTFERIMSRRGDVPDVVLPGPDLGTLQAAAQDYARRFTRTQELECMFHTGGSGTILTGTERSGLRIGGSFTWKLDAPARQE